MNAVFKGKTIRPKAGGFVKSFSAVIPLKTGMTSKLKSRLFTGPSRFYNSLCPAPSINDADGFKRADCLSLPDGRRVSARSGRFGDAQEKAGHGSFLLVRFSCACKRS
jgi:hypothetical protein